MDAKVIVKYRGVAIEWEEKDTHLIVPPLTVEGMEKASDAIVAHDAVDLKAPQDITKQMALKVPIVMLALQRNYPEITEAEVKALSTGTMQRVRCMPLSGSTVGTRKSRMWGKRRPYSYSRQPGFRPSQAGRLL